MRLSVPLDDLFESRSHVRVLRALDALPEGFATSARDLGRRAGVSHPTASKILGSLVAQGVARVRRAGRSDLYELNRGHELGDLVHALFQREARVRDDVVRLLSDALPKRVPGIREAYLFGSAAWGEMRPASDLDLAVIARGDEKEIRRRLEPLAEIVRARFGNDLSVHVSGEAVAKRRRARDGGRALWDRIAREGIPVFTTRSRSRAV